MQRDRSPWLGAALAACLLLLLSPSAGQAEFQRELSVQGKSLILVDLIGEIHLVGHDGDSFELQIDVQGEDASEEIIQIETDESDDRAQVIVRFPTDEKRRYRYPRMGRGSSTSFDMDHDRDHHDGGWISRIFGGGGRIKVEGRGSGLEVWADVTLRVPRGTEVEVYLGVGEIDARNVNADLRLDSNSGAIAATGIEGDVTLDTGSGSVEALEIHGALSIDTGSGHVLVENVTGDVDIDTGSGGVEVNGVESRTLRVDTGSGSVRCMRISCSQMEIDTGSGGVRASEVRADDAKVDTGSGGVELELVAMGSGDFEIDTGSGGISLVIPENASAEVHAETGSGGIRLDLSGADIRRMEKDEAHVVLGNGDARVRLDTGSGTIRIRH